MGDRTTVPGPLPRAGDRLAGPFRVPLYVLAVNRGLRFREDGDQRAVPSDEVLQGWGRSTQTGGL